MGLKNRDGTGLGPVKIETFWHILDILESIVDYDNQTLIEKLVTFMQY